jgi:hypothetical protein
VTEVLVILALVVAAGAVAAVAAPTPRVAVLGLLVALAGSAYVVEPFPGPVGLAARLAGTTLGAYLVWIALRRAPGRLPAASAGWAGSAAVAGVAFATGYLAAATLGPALAAGSPTGPTTGGAAVALIAGSPVPRAALGAALALVAVALPQVIVERDTLRLGMGLLLLVAATGLVANALRAIVDPVADFGFALFIAAAGSGVAGLVAVSVRRGGDLGIRDTLRPDAVVRHRPADDAHRVRPG